jgi:hypothetical protein
MKKLLVIAMLGMLVVPAYAHEQNCRTEVEYHGVYYIDCPQGLVVTGVDSRHRSPTYPPRVECSHVTLVCQPDDHDIEEDE